MIPVPTLAEIAAWSGRPETSYTTYIDSAALQATLQFSIVSELTADDYSALTADDQTLAHQGIIAMADWIYLRQPYQAVIANPLNSETIGSYSYSKPYEAMARSVQTAEFSHSHTGIVMWDLALQYLGKRTRAAGVFYGEVHAFDRAKFDILEVTWLRINTETGERELLGPADFNRLNIPFVPDINAEVFPADPGVG